MWQAWNRAVSICAERRCDRNPWVKLEVSSVEVERCIKEIASGFSMPPFSWAMSTLQVHGRDRDPDHFNLLGADEPAEHPPSDRVYDPP